MIEKVMMLPLHKDYMERPVCFTYVDTVGFDAACNFRQIVDAQITVDLKQDLYV